MALKPLGFEVINLGHNSPMSVTELISKIEDSVHKKAIINHLPYPKTDMKDTWANIDKAKALIGWYPQKPFTVEDLLT